MSIKLKDPSDLYYLNWAKDNFEAEEEAQGLDSKEDSKAGPIKKKRSPASLSIECPVCGGPAPDHVHFGGEPF